MKSVKTINNTLCSDNHILGKLFNIKGMASLETFLACHMIIPMKNFVHDLTRLKGTFSKVVEMSVSWVLPYTLWYAKG
jgi:hypothetical protein